MLARATPAPRGSWRRSSRLKVASALAAGFVLGSVGLASAGTLPGPAQDLAHTALGAVGVKVPPGHDRYNGPECGGTYANHGQYVRAHKGDPAAGRSPCGKPNASLNGVGADEPDADAQNGGGPPLSSARGKGDAKSNGKPGKGKKNKQKGDHEDAESTPAPAAPTTSIPAPTTSIPTPTTTSPSTTSTSTTSTSTTSTSTTTTSTTAPPPMTTTSTPAPTVP